MKKFDSNTDENCLAILSIASFVGIVFLGNPFDPTPSSLTITLFIIGAAAFSVLAFLRAYSFLRWILHRGGN